MRLGAHSLTLTLVGLALPGPASAADQVPAFPGAEGPGANTPGGRGGTVFPVTTLEDYVPGVEDPIPGSLRAAVESEGPRIVVFRVAVARARATKGGCTVVLTQPVAGVVPGQKRPHKDIRSTHFYNMSYCNRGYIVRNCTFKPQRRHAILVRAPGGLIEGNTMDGVGGSAVCMGNEMGSFYEGPFPADSIIRNNVVRNAQGPAICIYSSSLNALGRHARNIQVLNNTITLLPGKQGIVVHQARNVRLVGNRITRGNGEDASKDGITVTNSENVAIE